MYGTLMYGMLKSWRIDLRSAPQQCRPCALVPWQGYGQRGDMSTDQQETDQRSKHQRAVVQLASTSTKSR